MKKQLFFDDNGLFSKDNLTRRYGRPELVARYVDENVSTDFCTGWVFPLDGGGYRLMYFGQGKDFSGHKLFAARSEDGINFAPEALFDTKKHTEKQYAHEVLDLGKAEIGFIYEDKHSSSPDERYKLLKSEVAKDKIRVNDDVYVSPDLISWQKLDGASWADGAEPLASVYYNENFGVHTIIARDFWGIRSAGYRETRDFKDLTEYRYCVNVDSLDGDLAEIYGMYAFEYDGNYIGVPHIYHGFGSGLETKYKSGVMDTELAYSKDGRFWRRSLREPFISGTNGMTDRKYSLVWVNGMARGADGINLYASASEHEHGPAFSKPGTGCILVFKLREDGFISLASKEKDIESVVATREKIWHGGDLHINLKAKRATAAIYHTKSEPAELNLLSISSPIEGFTHEDCVEFSGDSTDWIPKYKSGRKLEELVGETIIIEIRFEDGEIFSVGGEFTDVFNVEAAIYRLHGVLRL